MKEIDINKERSKDEKYKYKWMRWVWKDLYKKSEKNWE